MRQAGDVVRVDIFQNDQGRSKGCGVVEFTNQQDCYRALTMFDQSQFSGRKLNIKIVSKTKNYNDFQDKDLHPLPN